MADLNRANRRVCDVKIYNYADMKKVLDFDTANVTTVNLESDNVYAMAKGSKRITFQNPLEGTMTIEAQVYPFQMFSLLSDGYTEAGETNPLIYAKTEVVTATAAGSLSIGETNIYSATSSTESGDTETTYALSVYKYDDYNGEEIKGTTKLSDSTITFSATTPADIVKGSKYKVNYVVKKTTADTGERRVKLNNNNLPPDYFITMSTYDKTVKGTWAPFIITAYKATIQRNFELSFSSEDDPASITLTFDLMEDENGDVIDMIEQEAKNTPE